MNKQSCKEWARAIGENILATTVDKAALAHAKHAVQVMLDTLRQQYPELPSREEFWRDAREARDQYLAKGQLVSTQLVAKTLGRVHWALRPSERVISSRIAVALSLAFLQANPAFDPREFTKTLESVGQETNEEPNNKET